MPTYEYECRKCHHQFETFQSMTDRPVAKCPKCKGPVRRMLGTGAGIIFKGTGFYETDYRRKSSSPSSSSDSSKSSGASDSAKSEKKAAAK